MIEIKAPQCRGEFRIFRSKLFKLTVVFLLIFHYTWGSPENDMQQKSLSNVSETKHDQMLISEFSQKVEPIRNCSFFPSKILFPKTNSSLII